MQATVVERGGHRDIGEGADRTGGDETEPAPEHAVRRLEPSVAVGEEIVEPEVEGHRAEGRDRLAPAEIGPGDQHESIEDRHVHQHAERPDRAEQREARRDDAAEALVVETGQEIECNRAVELAFAGAAGGEIHREVLHLERCFGSGEQVEQDLEADARKIGHQRTRGRAGQEEEAAHRVAQFDPGELAREHVGHARQLLAVGAAPFLHARAFGKPAGDRDLGLAALHRSEHVDQQLGIMLVIGIHHRDIGRSGGAETLDRRARQPAAADPLQHAHARVG